MIAASSLGIDYVLTVAVSVCAGSAAITSAFPALLNVQTWIAVIMITLLTIGNLRGMRDSSILFGVPTYLFILCIVLMIGTGLFKVLILHDIPPTPSNMPQQVQNLTVLLFLKAFSSGCTALTGVEAVSDGIPNFKAPAQKNAKRVLGLLACLVFVIFIGVAFLATMYHIVPDANITAIAQIATEVFGKDSIMFFAVQITTAIILTMAANTAFADLPMLLSILAKDGYAPRQFMSRGSRLSFSNGILVLFLLSGALVVYFHADTHLLMPLYAVGVFLSFTLSQAGMFMKWLHHKEGKWKQKAFINGLGTTITAITCVIIAASKFMHGAWIVLICIPILVSLMRHVHLHYQDVKHQLAINENYNDLVVKDVACGKVIIPIDSINKSFIKALNYANTLHIKDMEIYHVDINAEATKKLKATYQKLGIDLPLICEHAPYRNTNETLLNHIDEEVKALQKHQTLTVIMPQFVMRKKRYNVLHNQTSTLLKILLRKRRNVTVISVPYII